MSKRSNDQADEVLSDTEDAGSEEIEAPPPPKTGRRGGEDVSEPRDRSRSASRGRDRRRYHRESRSDVLLHRQLSEDDARLSRSEGKKKKKKKRRRRRDASSSSSGSYYGEESSESGVGTGVGRLRRVASRNPGYLTEITYAKVAELMSARGMYHKSGRYEGSLYQYLVSIVAQQHPELKNRPGISREMTTLSLALDLMLGGKTLEAADMLVQRFKSLELYLTTGSWEVSGAVELAPESSGLVSEGERKIALTMAKDRLRLAEGLSRLEGSMRPGADGAP